MNKYKKYTHFLSFVLQMSLSESETDLELSEPESSESSESENELELSGPESSLSPRFPCTLTCTDSMDRTSNIMFYVRAGREETSDYYGSYIKTDFDKTRDCPALEQIYYSKKRMNKIYIQHIKMGYTHA